MKISELIVLTALTVLASGSCRKDEVDVLDGEISGFLVLNNGNWGSNDASMSLYSPASGKVSGDIFFKANGRRLGDLGQNMLVHGDDIYIAVNGSRTVFVTDRNLKVKQTIKYGNAETEFSPRAFTAAEGKVYVTYYEGFLGEIDPSTYAVRVTAVGPNPEGVAYSGGKLYVANSGGYLPGFGNTVSIVDASSFKEISVIEVNRNPSSVVASDNGEYLYVSSAGNYDDIGPKLQIVDLSSTNVSDVDYEGVKGIAAYRNGDLLVVTASAGSTDSTAGTIWKHDADRNTKLGKFSDTDIPGYYSISTDPESGYVFAGASDYTTDGDVFWFGEDGVLKDKFDACGLNPQRVVYLGD